jgi:hypothetical protein
LEPSFWWKLIAAWAAVSPTMAGGRGVGPVGGVAQLLHLEGEVVGAGREQVDQGGVGGEADRLVLALQRALCWWPPQLAPIAVVP